MSTYDTNAPGAFGAGGYADASLAANTAYKNTLARINQKRSGTLRQYGYLGDINPETGVIQNVRVDGHNAYGQLQSMLDHQAGDFQQADFAAQERGLHGGLAHKAYGDLTQQHGAQAAQLGTGLVDTLSGFQDDQSQAAWARDRALYEAELAATRNAVDSGLFNPGDYTGLDVPAYGADPIPNQDPTAHDQPTTKTKTDKTDKTDTTKRPPGSSKADALARKLLSAGNTHAIATSKVAKASEAAKAVAAKAGQSNAQQALAARSAGLNAKYGIKKGGK